MLSEPKSYSEKRSFIRMKVEAPVQLRYGDREFSAICRNLSGSGLLLETDQELPVGATVEICIPQEGDNRVSFEATAEVNRVDAAENGRFIVGLATRAIHD